MDASSQPQPSRSTEPSPRPSLSGRLGGLFSDLKPEAPPPIPPEHETHDTRSDQARSIPGSPPAKLERLPPARVTTPCTHSTGDSPVNVTATRTKLSPQEAEKETSRVKTVYAPSAIETLHAALSEDLPSSKHKRPASSSSSSVSNFPPSFLASRTPRLFDALTRTTMPTASLSIPPKAYIHTPIPSPFRDTARATAQTEAALNSPISAAQSSIRSRSESPNKSPTFLAPTRSSIDTLRGTLERSESMHTTPSQSKIFGSWWFGDNKKDVDRLLDESDRAETAEQERDGFRSKCKHRVCGLKLIFDLDPCRSYPSKSYHFLPWPFWI